MSTLEQYINNVPDFPKPGIKFRDISPLFRNHFNELIEELANLVTAKELEEIDLIAGIEARGFAVGAALAYRLGKGFIPIRKKRSPELKKTWKPLRTASGFTGNRPGR